MGYRTGTPPELSRVLTIRHRLTGRERYREENAIEQLERQRKLPGFVYGFVHSVKEHGFSTHCAISFWT